MNAEPQTYILPAYWASALINGDTSGMEDDDETQLNEFLNKEQPGYCTGCSEEPFFQHSNDFNRMGGDCLEFYFVKHSNQ